MSGPVDMRGWRGWAGLVAAPAAWAVHHQSGSDLNFYDCHSGDTPTLIAIGLAMLVLVVVGGFLSFTAWRAAGGEPSRNAELPARLIPALGMMAAGLFGLTILVQIVAAVILPPCFR
jgi:hypothetical protein